VLLIGSCSATKRFPVHPLLRAAQVSGKTLAAYAGIWRDRITRAEPTAAARDMYAGVGAAALREAIQNGQGRLLFVSAGLGVVSASERIASYDLTVSRAGPGPFSVLKVPYRPQEWWAAVHPSRRSPLADYVRSADDTVVLALPAAYLAMVSEDLTRLSSRQVTKLRIIATGGFRVPAQLQEQCIWYDSRLNSLGRPYSGSMASLVSRAALHFATVVMADGRLKSAASHRARVEKILATQPDFVRAQREPQSDAQILKRVRSMVRNAFSTTRALEELRTAHGVACEAGRFRRLYEVANDGK